jgi:hypothetical protein
MAYFVIEWPTSTMLASGAIPNITPRQMGAGPSGPKSVRNEMNGRDTPPMVANGGRFAAGPFRRGYRYGSAIPTMTTTNQAAFITLDPALRDRSSVQRAPP